MIFMICPYLSHEINPIESPLPHLLPASSSLVAQLPGYLWNLDESQVLQWACRNGKIWLPIWLNNAKHVSNVVKYLVIFCEILDLKLHINVDKCAVLYRMGPPR
jgi:hypothetical protein